MSHIYHAIVIIIKLIYFAIRPKKGIVRQKNLIIPSHDLLTLKSS